MRVVYEEYIRSDAWRGTRKRALARAEYRCQMCGSGSSLDVHHNTYERLGDERDSDLIALCRKCHNCFHAIRDKRTKKKIAKKTGSHAPSHEPRLPKPPSPNPKPKSKKVNRLAGLWDEPLTELKIDARFVDDLTRNGGVSSLAIAIIGETWPPKAGWRQRAIGRVVRVNEDIVQKELDACKVIRDGTSRARELLLSPTEQGSEREAIRREFVSGTHRSILAKKYRLHIKAVKAITRGLGYGSKI